MHLSSIGHLVGNTLQSSLILHGVQSQDVTELSFNPISKGYNARYNQAHYLVLIVTRDDDRLIFRVTETGERYQDLLPTRCTACGDPKHREADCRNLSESLLPVELRP